MSHLGCYDYFLGCYDYFSWKHYQKSWKHLPEKLEASTRKAGSYHYLG